MSESLSERFRRDGVVHIPGALDAEDLKLARAGFEWSVANPSPAAQSYWPETGTRFYQDLFNMDSWPHYRPLLDRGRLPEQIRALFGCQNLWFFFEQVFVKSGGDTRRTPWHQDTSYFPVDGSHLAVVWMSFDRLQAEDSLEFIRGSHRGTLFNGSSFAPDDDTAPLYDEKAMPRLPDVEKTRAAYDIVSWACEPGDVVVFHPSVLHGGAPTRVGMQRRTLSLRFFGDDCRFVARPNVRKESDVGFNRDSDDSRQVTDFYAGLSPGDPFRHPAFIQLCPRPDAERAA